MKEELNSEWCRKGRGDEQIADKGEREDNQNNI